MSIESFITEKEEYLNEIFQRHGILRIPAEAHYVMVEANCGLDGGVRVRLADPCIAIISGNLHMAEYFWNRDGYGRRGCIEDERSLCGGTLLYFGSHFQLVDMWGFLEETWIDVLTVALFSGVREMIEWVLEHFKDIPWGYQLAHCIMWSDRSITELIWRYHLELSVFFCRGYRGVPECGFAESFSGGMRPDWP